MRFWLKPLPPIQLGVPSVKSHKAMSRIAITLTTVGILIWAQNGYSLSETSPSIDIKSNYTVLNKIQSEPDRLYQLAMHYYETGNTPFAQLTLTYILNIDPNHINARKLLSEGLKLNPDTLKEDKVIDRLLQESSINFYGGNYLKAKDTLEFLSLLDPTNPLIFILPPVKKWCKLREF